MAPNLFGTSASLFLEASQQNLIQEKSTTEKTNTPKLDTQKSLRSKSKYKWNIVWRNVIAFLYLHISAVYGLYLCFTGAKLCTVIYSKSFNIDFSLLTRFAIQSFRYYQSHNDIIDIIINS